ncbi:RagB/SusD family nutrient uptake outer membrane protein [Pedobacter foliorum]|uniref:RagB/SusD family nutrient uptake outer membrane protein n=1 Tax=Pedobacter foliorum TaxID=2739058 RepID=UPI001566DA71|nr:RagB/SusD family nutrient uptake outer membrane protein [Pedobacter foliorum]NRF39887.1 RagB/SusD family nutrient uptake outer membrane protein [Pedobacter foliorum]
MLKYYSNKLSLCAIFLVAFLAASCTKELDLKPSDTIDDSKAFQTVPDLNGGLIGAYASLDATTITNVSLTSDECTLPSENSTGRGVATYRWQYDGSSGTITAGWESNYISIDRVNRVLAYVDKVKTKPSEGEVKNQYKGELLALRAYCHFELLRNFASKYEASAMGVPYMEESKVSNPSRLTFAETISKIKADLLAAKGLIPSDFDDNTRITLNAVSAIQARVALYEKNWDDALKYSTEAINAAPLASIDDFADIWKDGTDDEVIWKLKRVTGDSRLGDFYYDIKNIVVYAPAFELINTFDKANDVRYSAYIKFDDTRGAGKSKYSVNKYLAGSSGLPNLTDVKLYRTGEMYLIRAEAYAEKSNLSLAAQDLNELRKARIDGYNDAAFADKQALLTAVVLERYKELAFEGHRFFDLRRNNLPITREPADAINALGATNLSSTNKEYAYPIPNAEIKANSNVKQNPLY